MYWLRPGTVFDSKSLVAFSGLHSLQQQVYFYPNQPALAVLVQHPVQEEMIVHCTSQAEGIRSLHLAHRRISYLRVVSMSAEKFTYHGVWMITKMEQHSAEAAEVAMISMPDLP